MSKLKKAFQILSVLMAVVLAALGIVQNFIPGRWTKVEAVQKPLAGDAYSFDDSNGIVLHDPTLFRANDGTYYLYGSHMVSAKSDDLINWHTISSGVFDSNRTLIPEGSTVRETLAEPLSWCDATQTQWGTPDEEWQTNIWAADVFYNKAMGKYCYYASCSLWGVPQSVIWFATSDSPEGPFEYQKSIVYSGFNKRATLGKPENETHYNFTNIPELIADGIFTRREIEKQDFFTDEGYYNTNWGAYPNCIDPGVFYDKNGDLWMTYGSWSGGIYIMPLVEKTGLPDYKKMRAEKDYNLYFGKLIASSNEGNFGSGEGPFITYDEVSGYYYFFQTYSTLGALGGYNIREYRSENPDGPYVDIVGNSASDFKNTGIKIIGNYKFSSNETALLSGGHSSCMVDEDGKVFQAYHTRYNDGVGDFHTTDIHQMLRTESGWLAMLPFKYSGETVSESGYEISEIAREYELVDFSNRTFRSVNEGDWNTVNSIISPTQKVKFTADGKITGLMKYDCDAGHTNLGSKNIDGSWSVKDGTYFVNMTVDGVRYEGVVCKMKDAKGNDVMAISFIGNDNSCIWCVSV